MMLGGSSIAAPLAAARVAPRRVVVTVTAAAASDPAADYRIAVPSYDRAQTLQRDTLRALRDAGIDCSARVDVFVANQQQAEEYARTLSADSYASICVGTSEGVGKQRDFILDHFGAGKQVVMVDDDIQLFNHKYGKEVNLDLHKAIVQGFKLSQHHDCYMWGLNNAANPFFQRPTYSVGYCFFQGPFMAFRVRDGVRLDPSYHQVKEDVQYSLMHCELDGRVLRLNGLSLKARPYCKEPGGLQSYATPAQRADWGVLNQAYLMQRYGQ